MLELWARFKTAPETFTNSELAKFAPAFIKTGIALNAAGAGGGTSGGGQDGLAGMVAELRKRLAENPEVMDQVIAGLSTKLLEAADVIDAD